MVSYAEVGRRKTRRGLGVMRTLLLACVVLVLATVGALAAQPVITGVSIPDVAMRINDSVTATISVQSDSATVYTLNASTIGGYALGSLSKQNSTTYTAEFTINSGGTDYAAGADIPTSISLEGTGTGTWSTAISQASDPIDANAPTVAISDDEAGTANIAGGDVTYTFDFNETVTGFTSDDVVVANGTKGTFTPISGTQFTLVVTPDAGFEGDMTVDVEAGVATDDLGNPNSAATQSVQYVDTLAPFVTSINRDGDNPTNASSVTYTVSFNEAVSDIETGDFVLTLSGTTGTVTGVSNATGASATVSVSSVAGDGTLGLNFDYDALDSVVDSGGNPATTDFTGQVYTIDNTDPTVTVNIVDASLYDGDNSSLVTFEFSEGVENFTLGDVDESGGTLDSFESVDADSYTAIFTATDGVDVTGSVTVPAGSYTDPASNNGGVGSDTVDIDTLNPTISQIIRDDVNPTNAAQVSMQIDFSESVSGVATGNFTRVVTGGQATASIDSVFTVGPSVLWIIRLNTVDDATGTLTIDLDSNLSGITDAAGNELLVGRSADETYDVDRLDPTVTNVTVDDLLISESDAGNTFTVDIYFSEPMDDDGSDDPTITLDPTVIFTLTLASPGWVNSQQYRVQYLLVDADKDVDSVTIDVTLAKDEIGNAQQDYTAVHEFAIDTVKPTVSTIDYLDSTPSYTVTADDDTDDGANAAAVHVTFSEPMTTDGSADPTITFSPNVDSTLPPGLASTQWDSSTEFVWGTLEQDANVDVNSVTVDASGAKDAAGNDMEDYTPVSEFEIDTVNPQVNDLVVNDTFITDADTPGNATLVIEIQCSEAMDETMTPTVIFDPTIASTLSWDSSSGWDSSTEYHAIYDVADGNVDVDTVTVDVTGLKDLVGNDQQNMSPWYDIEIDTLNPSVTVNIVDTQLNDTDSESLVTFEFSEDVSGFTIADLTPANGGLTSFSMVDGDSYTVLFTATDGIDATGSVAVGTGYTDLNSNQGSGNSDTVDIDTENPSVSTVVADTAIIYEGDLQQGVTVTFDEPMDTGTDPTITFGVGTFTTNSDGNWDSSTQYSESFTHTGTNIEQTYVEIGVTGAKDAVGNDQAPYTPEDKFDIDTIKPTVSGVSVSEGDLLISDPDVGTTLRVTTDFSEPMDSGTTPTITFSPTLGTTLSFDSGSWLDSDTYAADYDMLDGGVDHDDVTVDVSGAKDAAGNGQEDFTPTSEFEVDTLNPTILSITSITADGYYNSGTIDVTVTFSESVTLSGGTLDVTLDTPSDVVSVTGFTGWTDASTNYSIGAGDNSCDLDAIGIALNGATLRDLADNDAVVSMPATTIADGSDIAIDTTDPVISGLDLPDTTQSVDAGCSITIPYSATLTDNCCINTGVGSSDVQVTVTIVGGSGTATLDAPAATIANNGIDRIDISGSFTVSDVSGGDVDVQVEIDCLDCAGNSPAAVSDTVTIDDSTDPVISGFNLPDNVLYMDPDTCIYTVPYSATINDNCCLDAGNVSVVVELVAPYNTATLSAPAATISNAGGSPNTQVDISGSFEVSALTDDPVHVRIRINATDCNGNAMTEVSDTAVFEDGTNPTIGWNTDLPDTTQYVDEFTCIIVIPVQATVTDACCINAADVDIDIQLTNATLSHTVTASQVSQGVVNVQGEITVSALTGCPAALSITINGTDCAGNDAIQLADAVGIEDNTIPIINDLRFDTDDNHTTEQTEPYLVDECGLVVVYFSGNVTDNCCIVPANVVVTATLPMLAGEGAAIVEDLVFTPVQNGQGQVDFTGSAVVRCLESCPPGVCMSRVQINVTASDCCGNPAVSDATGTGEGLINDIILPIPRDDPRQDMVLDESAVIDPLVEVRLDEFDTYRLVLRESTPIRIDVMGNDADNLTHNVDHPFGPCVLCGPCGGQTGCCATMYIDDIVEHPSYGTATIEDDTGDCAGGTIIRYAPDRGYLGPDYFTYRIRDAFGNVSSVIATVYLQVVPEVWMEDVFVIACTGETVEFRISAADLFIDPDDPEIILFGFSITDGPEHGVIGGSLLDVIYTPPSTITDPQFGVQVPSLDFSEAAGVVLTYTPADGFLGTDRLRIRFEDPFGGFAYAVVDITVGQCVTVGDSSTIYVIQGQLLPLILPISFTTVFEAGMGTVTLISLEDGTLYPAAITAEWSEGINRHILIVNTAGLPLGSYGLKLPLGTGEIVTLTIEVGEGE